MNDMVSQVVQVLDEGNPFISSNRVLKSRVKKLQRRRRPIRPTTTTGALDASQKHKERDRKRAKDQHQKKIYSLTIYCYNNLWPELGRK